MIRFFTYSYFKNLLNYYHRTLTSFLENNYLYPCFQTYYSSTILYIHGPWLTFFKIYFWVLTVIKCILVVHNFINFFFHTSRSTTVINAFSSTFIIYLFVSRNILASVENVSGWESTTIKQKKSLNKIFNSLNWLSSSLL